MVTVASLDHLVLTVADVEVTVAFYERVLGMRRVVPVGLGPTGVAFGRQKLNVHQAGRELEPKAARPTPGSADICFLLDGSLDAAIQELGDLRIPIEDGPIERLGAQGPMNSIYFRDPDGNLLEVSELISAAK